MNNLLNIFLYNKLLFLTSIGILGLIVGSFLNVVIYRLPIMLSQQEKPKLLQKKINLFVPRSHCPKCKATIPWYLNIPVLSYIVLKGRCAKCKTKIPILYLIVELLSCFTSIIVALRFGPTWQTIALLPLTWGLIPLVFIDIDQFLLPDVLTLSLLWFGLFVSTFNIFINANTAIIGALIGYLSFWIIAKIFYLVRKIEGMGYGDFKLLAVFGAFIGWQALPMIVFLASLFGLIIGGAILLIQKRSLKQQIPFGPYIALAGWVVIVFTR
jgi:leader peptidase (prepilin peptidase)/N-methyltransferase